MGVASHFCLIGLRVIIDSHWELMRQSLGKGDAHLSVWVYRDV